jgi:transcription elongation factor GreB
MSKAFTRESDDADEPVRLRPSAALPPGVKNHLTPDGAGRLREELAQLVQMERPPLATRSDDADARRQLQRLDARIFQLEESLRTAVITPPPATHGERRHVRFGASVTVRRRNGEATYRIVGVDEIDLDRGWVSILSPIARALLNGRLGERVRFEFPSGEEVLEIVRIDYA